MLPGLSRATGLAREQTTSVRRRFFPLSDRLSGGKGNRGSKGGARHTPHYPSLMNMVRTVSEPVGAVQWQAVAQPTGSNRQNSVTM